VALSAPFFDGTPLPMVATIALCAVLAMLVGLAVLRRPARLAPAAAE
jgi:DHA1 family bicyclomycin/chloramphenicol resistance-like MFS transporter